MFPLCVCVQELAGCEMAIWGHASGPLWQWARVIISSQWDAVLFFAQGEMLIWPCQQPPGWMSPAPRSSGSPSPPRTTTAAEVLSRRSPLLRL